MEVKGTAAGVVVVDDFAHHPTAVEVTLRAARARWPKARLWAVFEPRSLTASRADFGPAYRRALAVADGVALAAPYHAARLSRNGGPGALDIVSLVEDLSRAGRLAFWAKDADAIVEELVPRLAPGDVVLGMSSGAFGGLHGKLLDALRRRETAPPAFS